MTLTAPVIGFVLLAAVLHAAWNTLLRSGSDRFLSMAWMCLAIALVSAPALPFLVRPAAASWPYLAASTFLHLGYNLFLVRAYRTGELGLIYPIARGASPLLVALGAAAFAGERLSGSGIAGIQLVSGGIMALALRGRGFSYAGVPAALATSCFIGAYSVMDGIGVRLAGDDLGYTAWMFVFWGLLTPLVFVVARGLGALRGSSREMFKAASGGVVSMVAYGLVIWAMGRDAMGPVSALRETSVVFAALFGRFFLAETLTARRMTACTVIAAGAAVLGYGAHAS